MNFGTRVPEPEPEIEVETETIETDTVVEFPNTEETASVGLHSGVITKVETVRKTFKKVHELPEYWIRFTVAVEEQDMYGGSLLVVCEAARDAKSHGASLREVLYRLGFKPPTDKKFELKSLEGTEVDVYVRHNIGDNKESFIRK